MSITIYEPLYLEGQVLSEPLFVPFEHKANAKYADWREFRIYVDMYRQGKHRVADRCGMFSPKFQLKTRTSAQTFLDFCQQHEDVDVCFINPFPQLPYYSYNIWMQAEANHPGITECAQNLLDASGIAIDLAAQPRHSHDVLAYSNFWVGSEKFWDLYVGGVLEKIAVFLDQQPDHPAARGVLTETYHTDPAPFLPFIIERMFTVFLSVTPSASSVAYRLDPLDYCLSERERNLVQQMMPVVDEADAKRFFSPELREHMWDLCISGNAKAKEYFATHPHPHTGRTIPSA